MSDTPIPPASCLNGSGDTCTTCRHFNDDHNSAGCCLCKCNQEGTDRD